MSFRRPLNPRRVVYSCLFGHSEKFLNHEYEHDGSIDFVLFTDDPEIKSDFWTTIVVPRNLLDPARQSKGFKHEPHLFLQEYDCSLYLDNTVRLKLSVEKIFENFDKSHYSISLFTHPDRNCVYLEAEEVARVGFDNQQIIQDQIKFYREIGFPENYGLHATTLILRSHRDVKLNAAMSDWHKQVLRFSKRDQISFDVIRYFYELEVETIYQDLRENNLMEWPFLPDGKRIPRVFDPQKYLEFNPDVRESGVDPYKHYLEFGIDEGRRFV